MLSAKCLTQNCHLSVCFKRNSCADSGKNCAKYLHEAYLNNNLVFCLVAAFFGKGLQDHYVTFTFFVSCNVKNLLELK